MYRLNQYELVRERVASYPIASKAADAGNIANILINSLQLDKKIQEHFCVLVLNTKLNIIGVHTISIGTVDAAPVHPREVFQAVLSTPAGAALIIAHNHPSGDTVPSSADIDLTKRLKDCADLLGYKLLDHIIIGGKSYMSMKENGYF